MAYLSAPRVLAVLAAWALTPLTAHAQLVAPVKVGATGTITTSADTGNAGPPGALTRWETARATSACLARPGSKVLTQRDAAATPTYRIVIAGVDQIPFPLVTHRIAVRFHEVGVVTHGESRGAVVREGGNRMPGFVEVTTTHLPTSDLQGFSMDARFGDVDGDGDLDVVIAQEFRPNILLLNDGEGRFANVSAARLPQVNRDSEDVGIADFNGDGHLDIVVVSEDDQVNELYLNDGRGFFADAGGQLPVTGTSNAVLAADIDVDGAPDILIGNNGQNVLLINDGQGFFRDETAQRLPGIADVTQDIELGDMDGDGDFDLLVGNEDANRLLLNNGQGRFTDVSAARLPLRTAAEETREADFGDVDGDGDLDILFANVKLFVAGALAENRLLINDGMGFFTDETMRRLPADRDHSMDGDFVDVDADGDLDIMTANFDSLTGRPANAPYRVYLNRGPGVFADGTAAVLPPGVTGNGFDIEAADLNGDGRVDLYLAGRGGPDRLLLGHAGKGKN